MLSRVRAKSTIELGIHKALILVDELGATVAMAGCFNSIFEVGKLDLLERGSVVHF